MLDGGDGFMVVPVIARVVHLYIVESGGVVEFRPGINEASDYYFNGVFWFYVYCDGEGLCLVRVVGGVEERVFVGYEFPGLFDIVDGYCFGVDCGK